MESQQVIITESAAAAAPVATPQRKGEDGYALYFVQRLRLFFAPSTPQATTS